MLTDTNFVLRTTSSTGKACDKFLRFLQLVAIMGKDAESMFLYCMLLLSSSDPTKMEPTMFECMVASVGHFLMDTQRETNILFHIHRWKGFMDQNISSLNARSTRLRECTWRW